MKTNRVSFVCKRASELRKGKSIAEMSQHDAFVIANKEYNDEVVNNGIRFL